MANRSQIVAVLLRDSEPEGGGDMQAAMVVQETRQFWRRWALALGVLALLLL